MKTIMLWILLVFANTAIWGQTDSEYAKTLKKMFEVSGSEATYQGVISQMVQMFKNQNSALSGSDFDAMEAEFKKTSIYDLAEMLVPVYSKHLTMDDLKAIIQFYESPAGKKLASKTPMITQESMAIGQEWGYKIGMEIQKKLEEKKD
ncbi:MAG: DUF2059 domain-containing protein [Saprospiraceae bacterium]|nr:DUF2059 domain-containing protein [Saprospiraceae bacterium]